MADRVGQRFGDYRLIRFLGEGTFGDVYLGEQVYQKAPAAVKVFKTKLTPDKFKDFINEVRTVLLRHPNIVPIIDFGVGENDIAYLVMEYAPNGTLLQRHPRRTRLPLATVVTYVKQIAAALQYAHDQRRIHRDVKPENMLFGANNEILLSDFGIAVVAHNPDSQRTEDSIGTARYMAPEQWQGKPLTATDQYALGIIVYEWLCGECPFSGNTLQLMYKHIQDAPPRLREKVPTISPEVEQVVMTALAKDPKRRFASVRAFANALEQAYKAKPALGTLICTYRGHFRSKINQYNLSEVNQGFFSALYSDHCSVWALAWSPDGTRIASGSYNVHIWNASTGNHIISYQGFNSRDRSSFPHFIVKFVTWSSDGKRIAFGYPEEVQIWDITRGDVVTAYRDQFINIDDPGHDNMLYTDHRHPVSWSPDGTRIASACETPIVQIWDTATGNMLFSYQSHAGNKYRSDWVSAIQWSPDGRYIASLAASEVHVWEVATRRKISTYPAYGSCLAWSPSGKRIASSRGNEIHIWDITNGKTVLIYRDSSHATDLSWSPDGKYIASAHENTVHIWNAVLGNHVYTYRGHTRSVNAVAWSPDSTRVASASEDETVQVWQAV